MNRTAIVLILAALLAPAALAARPAESAPAVGVTVSCATNPERTTVRNNTGSTIRVQRIGSLYQPLAAEPYAIGRNIGPGGVVTFQSGSGATANVITKQFIYNNDVGSTEGARVKTSIGRFIDRCG